MIEVSPETACIIYLGLTVVAVFIAWIKHNKKNQSKEIITFTSGKITCEFCNFSYVDDVRKSLTRCPQCQFMNKNIK